MRDPVIVEAVRTPIGNGKPTRALAGVHPVDSISRDVRPALDADLTARYPQLRRYATPDNVVSRHGR
jgi:hypothetical protein